MYKYRILEKIVEKGIVAVIRAESSEKAIRITEACLEGGINSIEITFTVPAAHRLIEDLSKRFHGQDVLLGAGTVLDAETARAAILSGASYIVSPALNLDTMKLCNRYQVPCMPGAMTVREVIMAMEAGADIIKIFPGSVFGPEVIKAIKGPLPQASLMPTGGVELSNAVEWLKAGSIALGAGSSLTAGAKTGDYNRVTETAREFVRVISDFRGNSNVK
ncbi:MAG: Bifunctional 2-keto-4-hydroxyglutarate aldolase/2-keto-3-deoxy-6-phosphogluconate aldolase [Firmicutes bacterium]|nr:Bifunctional 2-keto-4-hydroxyglutarate aldolase/2-keto-3-deoxy-6-phosphogluconate aldolase [Bacillota bacterium]MDI6705204.1 bifunctional 2-keto-4-hydroxyglutarate aldolase/2-keto-3-deoxy-6-phosphogluconate aldolase [Bacillota bacterium]